MEDLSKELIGLLQFLLPGFVAAWVFYGLTSHPKPSQFERVVQALIFTLFVQALVALEHRASLWIGESLGAFGEWGTDTELVWVTVTALIVGVLFAWLAHRDTLHTLARNWRITTRASFPSEWFHAFCETESYVVLHLKDERRLFGWPRVWPSDPERGHFLMMRASWAPQASASGEAARAPEAPELGLVVINVEDVRWVEFLTDPVPKA